MNIAISIQSLKKTFGTSEIFEDFSLDVEFGKITAIFGPNGAGKSTLLNILAGVVSRDSGKFNIKDFNHFEFSYIFQNYRESLLPWRTSFENLALPLQIQKKRVATTWTFGEVGCGINQACNLSDSDVRVGDAVVGDNGRHGILVIKNTPIFQSNWFDRFLRCLRHEPAADAQER